MTLVLGAVAHGMAVLVADRLVSLQVGRRLEALDQSANKLLAYVARDAHVAIGYAGQAFVGRIPTDEFIAQILAGATFTRASGEFCGVGLGCRIPRYDIGLAISKVIDALILKIRPGQVIQLIVFGHQFDRKGLCRPLAMRAELTSGGVRNGKMLPRRTANGFGMVDHVGLALPDTEIAKILDSVFHDPMVTSLEQVATTLTEAIRRNGAPGIGPNTSAVILPLPGRAPIQTAFFPVTPHFAVLKSDEHRAEFVADISPWIIAPGLLKPPSFETGGMTLHADGLEFLTRGTPNAETNESGLMFAFSTMPRFDLPPHVLS